MGGREEHAAFDEQAARRMLGVCMAYTCTACHWAQRPLWPRYASLPHASSSAANGGPFPCPCPRRPRRPLPTHTCPTHVYYLQLLVLCSRWIASFHWSVKTNVFHSGIKLLIGQPVCVWQNGVPQSMHRAACLLRSSSSWPSIVFNSFQSWRLRRIGCRAKERWCGQWNRRVELWRFAGAADWEIHTRHGGVERGSWGHAIRTGFLIRKGVEWRHAQHGGGTGRRIRGV